MRSVDRLAGDAQCPFRVKRRTASGARFPYDQGVPFGLGVPELVILLVVLALLFGAKGLPDVAKRLGSSVREVREAVGEVDPRRMLESGSAPEKPTPKPPPDQA
jgi:sec-independent protein translocase protein TatA